jgi:hypothetical protein
MNDKVALRLSENAHLPFDKLGALSKVEASKGGVTLIPRHCGVLRCTPHSSGFRPAAKPAGWTFSISLSESSFSTVSSGMSWLAIVNKVITAKNMRKTLKKEFR